MLNNLRLLGDLILVRPLPQRSATVIIPDTVDSQHAYAAGEYSDAFEAVVVAAGPGDRLLHGKCDKCGATKDLIPFRRVGGMGNMPTGSFGACGCRSWSWSITGEDRVPMPVSVGDTVVIPRRPTSCNAGDPFVIDGEKLLAFHAEQFCLGLIEKAVA